MFRFWLLGFLICVPIMARPAEPAAGESACGAESPEIAEAFDHLYNFNFPAAHADINRYIGEHSREPLGYAIRAAALQILDLMRDASESIGAPLGSDYYRQRGIAFFQLGNKHDDEAKVSFAQSERQMRKLGEGESEAQVLMTGTRHINLLGKPDWDGALRVMEMVENIFPSDSLEASMPRHWAAACGLLTGDGRIRQRTRELLAVNQQTAARFGHQATVSKIGR